MSRPVSETCPVCGTPGRIVGGDEGTQHFEPEAAWVSPAVTRRAEIAERKALAALLGEAWLAHDLANDAYLAKDVPRPTVAEYAGFAAAIAARLHDLGVRLVATPTPPEIDVDRLAPLLAVEFGKAGFFRVGASMEFLTEQAHLMLQSIAAAYRADLAARVRALEVRKFVKGESDWQQGFRQSRNETVAAVLALLEGEPR